MKITLLIFSLLLGTYTNQSFAADPSSLQRLNAFLARASSLQAQFSQVLTDEKGNVKQRSSGEFYLQRPGKFRWNYLKPYRQEIVSNGGRVWFYDPDLEQVTTRRVDNAIGSTPALLLSGEVALEQRFVIDSQGVDEGLYWIRLTPKDEESGFRSVLIGLEGENLAGMELLDNFGQKTRIYFTEVQTRPHLEANLFEFRPPAGVDVLEDK
jgi:outer membrane lipoprotein carrier protein